MKYATFCNAPEAGAEGLIRYIDPDPEVIYTTKNWLNALAAAITESPGYVDDPQFSKDLRIMTSTMKVRYDYVFYVPIYGWNIVDDGRNKIDEDFRVRFDDNVMKLLLLSGVAFHAVPETTAWDRAKFVADVVK